MAAKVTAKKTTKKTTAQRSPARPQPSAPTSVQTDNPRILRFVTTGEDEPEEREPLFYIDDREYTIPKMMCTSDALECLHVFRTQGDVFGTDFLLEKLLGPDTYAALRSYKRLTAADLTRIIEVAQARMMGAAEAPKA